MKSIAVVETDGTSLVAVQRGDLDLVKDKKARELSCAFPRMARVSERNIATDRLCPARLAEAGGRRSYLPRLRHAVQENARVSGDGRIPSELHGYA